MLQMMRGDSYNIAITLTDDENQPITPADVAEVEIALGDLKKTYTSGDVAYNDGKWLFPVSQDETLSTVAAVSTLQVRVKYLLGDVVGARVGNVYIVPSSSNEVL